MSTFIQLDTFETETFEGTTADVETEDTSCD